MSYQNIMNAPLFDFGDIKKSEITIKNTWNEFQAALANKTFKYDEVESAMTTTFLKVFDDLFANVACGWNVHWIFFKLMDIWLEVQN